MSKLYQFACHCIGWVEYLQGKYKIRGIIMKLKKYEVYYTEKIEKQMVILAEDEPNAWERFEKGKYLNEFCKTITTNRKIEIDFVEECKKVKQ